jgi:hypothetical protein
VPLSPFQQQLIGLLVRAPKELGEKPPARDVLVLSGGSQHGLFGTGFFLGLRTSAEKARQAAETAVGTPGEAEARRKADEAAIPTYRIVTGISTGSLQSTMLFLANQPVPTDRTYPADLGFAPEAIPTKHSNIEDLAVASLVQKEGSLLKVSSLGIGGAALHGAAGSLDPLRERLYGFISPQTLLAVGGELHAGRRLYVGVSDLDDANGYAIDLTALAARIGPTSSAAEVDTVRRCYVDALIASSSVPLGAYPVSLGIRPITGDAPRHDLFIDGGARYGVFLRQIQDVAQRLNADAARANAKAADEARRAGSRALAAPPLPATNVTLIVNGAMYSTPWLEKGGQRPEKWSVVTAGLRAVSLLENQVYRFSVDQVESFPRAGGALRMAFISNENLNGAEEPDDHEFARQKCKQWSDADDRTGVMEFHPHYMACLLDYGRQRGEAQQWNVNVRATAPEVAANPGQGG